MNGKTMSEHLEEKNTFKYSVQCPELNKQKYLIESIQNIDIIYFRGHCLL